MKWSVLCIVHTERCSVCRRITSEFNSVPSLALLKYKCISWILRRWSWGLRWICHLQGAANPLRRSQRSRDLRRGSAAARLLVFRVRIPPRAWKPVSCEYCVLSGRRHCDEFVTRPEVLRRCVWSRNIRNEKVMVRFVLQPHRKRRKPFCSFTYYILVISAAELKNVKSRRLWLKFCMPCISL